MLPYCYPQSHVNVIKLDCILSQLCTEFICRRLTIHTHTHTHIHTQPRSHRRGPHSSTYVTKDKPVTDEKFAALVVDRLRAVIMDRDGMTQRVRDRARQQKMNYDDIMVCTVIVVVWCLVFETCVIKLRPFEALLPPPPHIL